MNAYEGHIGTRQGVFLIGAALVAMLFLQYPEFLVAAGGPAGWQVAVVMTVTALALFLPIAALTHRFPGLGLAEISEDVAGPLLGPLLTLLVSLWLILSETLTLRNFTETFITSILPHTPPSVLIISALACVAYASHRGLEAVSRTTQILFPLILGGGFIMVIFSLPRADLSLLYPFWGYGLGSTLMGGVYYAGMAAEMIILLVLGYSFRDGKALRQSGIYGILLFGVVASLSVAILVAVFGAQDAAQSPFPMFELARLVYLGRFLQRLESIVVLFWIYAAAVRMTVIFHAAVVAMGGALRLPFYRPLIFPTVVIVGALSLVPKDFVTVLRLERDWDRLLGLAILGVPILLLILAVVRKRGGQTHAS